MDDTGAGDCGPGMKRRVEFAASPRFLWAAYCTDTSSSSSSTSAIRDQTRAARSATGHIVLISASGIGRGAWVHESTQATRTMARQQVACISSVSIRWSNTRLARRGVSTRVDTCNRSLKRTGFRYRISRECTVKSRRCCSRNPSCSKPLLRSHSVRARSKNRRWFAW